MCLADPPLKPQGNLQHIRCTQPRLFLYLVQPFNPQAMSLGGTVLLRRQRQMLQVAEKAKRMLPILSTLKF